MDNIVFGIHAVKSTLEKPETTDLLIIDRKRNDSKIQQIIQIAKEKKIKIKYADIRKLDKITQGKHQGVALQLKNSQHELAENDLWNLLENTTSSPIILILDGITDPHNLGACIRSADAAGVNAVIIPKDKSASLTPVVKKVACGAAESIPLFTVSNLARTLRQLADQGIWIIGTDDQAKDSMYDANYTVPIAIVLGNEGTGMRHLTTELCQQLISIPMQGSVSSLNVSVATGVILFEAVRQRLKTKAKAI